MPIQTKAPHDFDEEILSYGFFATAEGAYVTQFNSKMRADTLIMLRAVHLMAPDTITILMVVAARKAEDAREDSPKIRRIVTTIVTRAKNTQLTKIQ